MRDLVAVVQRHWKLVGIATLAVAAASWFSGRRQITRYQSQLTVQISSSKQVFSRLDEVAVDELALQTDPVLSEALVLTTQALALEVVDALQLQVETADPRVSRDEVFSAVTVDSGYAPGSYALVRGPSGYEVHDGGGRVLARGSYDQPARVGGVTLAVLPASEDQTIPFDVTTREQAAAWVSGGLSYRVREGTTAVDITFTATDRYLVPKILNAAALTLRMDGARRAREIATRRRSYIADQLARADSSYRRKLAEVQQYKEGQQISNLSVEEQAVVATIQTTEQERQMVAIQASTLREAMGEPGSEIDVETLNRLAAVEGIAQNSALGFQIQSLLTLYEERRTLTSGALGLRERSPQVGAIDERIRQGHTALRTAVGAALHSLESRQGALDTRITTLRSRLQTFPGKESRIGQLQLETSILNDTYRYLLGQYEAARLQEATIAPYINLLDPASPAYPVGTSLREKALLGVLVGLLLGLAAAFFLEYLDQTIKNAADVERVIGVPVLGQIPDHPGAGRDGRRGSPGVITQTAPDEPAAEAFRALRTNVTFVGAERPLQLIMVTSPGPGEGKSTTAANLAVALAQSGQRTLLVDADLRRPQVHRAFSLVQEPGLTDILVNRTSAREAIRPEVQPKLDVLPAGPTPPNPSELLGSNPMQALIGELRRTYDYIVLDTPPTLPVTDAAVVASSADGAIMVLRSGVTEEIPAQRAVEQLKRVHARVAGVVLNGVNQRRDQYYTYYAYKEAPRRTPAKPAGTLLSR
ncbi:MAG TPA: polysaccharide biosynthesis tyrosine autokinase [Gemmatimonadales bacterium]|nr:polysaccharide biosynthesis tyrosine autokinase [Gemmatimonadales bacterium]